MKRIFLSLFVVASLLFVFSSCNKDEKATEDAKKTIENAISDMGDDLAGLSESEGMKSMESFSSCANSDDPFSSYSKSTASDLKPADRIKKAFLPNFKKSEKSYSFNFDNKVGTYSWNAANQNWNIELGNPADQIVIKFPAEDSTSTDNNAVLTLSTYSEMSYTDDWGYTSYQPTEIAGNLTVDDVEMIKVDYSAEYSSAGTPTSLDALMEIKPYSFSAEMKDEGTSASADADISLNGSTVFGAGIDITFVDDTQEEPTKFDGYFTYRKIKLKGKVDIKKLESDVQTASTEEELIKIINKNVNLSLNEVGGDKMADIKAVKNPDYDGSDYEEMPFDIVFEYPDGSTESVEKYADDFSSNMEQDAQALEDFFETVEETFSKK